MFNTLQDRLVKETRLRAISSIEEGNKYLEEYLKEHTAYYAVTPENATDVHRACNLKILDDILCCHEKRKLSKNLELSFDSRILQIKPDDAKYSLKGAEVTIIESLEGVIKIVYEGKELGYKELLVKDHQGQIKNKKEILLAGLPPLGEG